MVIRIQGLPWSKSNTWPECAYPPFDQRAARKQQSHPLSGGVTPTSRGMTRRFMVPCFPCSPRAWPENNCLKMGCLCRMTARKVLCTFSSPLLSEKLQLMTVCRIKARSVGTRARSEKHSRPTSRPLRMLKSFV